MEESLPIVECFHSLQGEGKHVGRSAYFIRLAMCKVGCPWCDTKESWIKDNHPKIKLKQLSINAAKAQSKGAAFVVITGGEPLHHNLNALCSSIREMTINNDNQQSIPIHLETSGVEPLSGNPDWITLSPKPHAPPQSTFLEICHEIKVIIHSKEDLLFAEEMAQKVLEISSKKVLLYLQPGWGNDEGNFLASEYVKSHPQWRLSIQTHKLLGIR